MWIKPFRISKVSLNSGLLPLQKTFSFIFPLYFIFYFFFCYKSIYVWKKNIHFGFSGCGLFNMSPRWNMQCSYPAHFRGTCLIGFNYYCLWSSLKRSKKGSVDNADPHGFHHTPCALSLLYMHAHGQTHTHNPPHPAQRSALSHTHVTPPTVSLQIANQGDSIDLCTTVRKTRAERAREKYVSK